MSEIVAPAALLAAPTLHADLRRMVRRRVPERDVDDVIQEVLCDALASNVPASCPRDIARWVMAIARHKIADYHRRAVREPLVAAQDHEPSASPTDVEDRELLGLAVREARREPRGGETLEWIFREVDGETLVDIARKDDVAHAAARQRVSRLRKRLRAALLFAATLGVVAAACWSSLRDDGSAPPIAIVPDATAPTVPTPAPTGRPAGMTLDGTWKVVAVEPAPSTQPTLAGVMRAQAAATRVVIAGDHVTISTPARDLPGTFTLEGTSEPGRFLGRVETSLGASPIEVVVQNGHLTIRATGGLVAGSVELER